MRIAIVDAGIAGLGSAWLLHKQGHAVTLFEAEDHLGGHATQSTWPWRAAPVDTGFLVFNDRTYPKLVALLAELGIESVATEMSFSARIDRAGIEWCARACVRCSRSRATPCARISGGCCVTRARHRAFVVGRTDRVRARVHRACQPHRSRDVSRRGLPRPQGNLRRRGVDRNVRGGRRVMVAGMVSRRPRGASRRRPCRGANHHDPQRALRALSMPIRFHPAIHLSRRHAGLSTVIRR